VFSLVTITFLASYILTYTCLYKPPSTVFVLHAPIVTALYLYVTSIQLIIPHFCETMVTSPTIPTDTKARVLIIGATGFIGRFVAEASLLTAHPTYLLLRPPPLVPSKDAIVKTFQEKGAIVLHVSHNMLHLILLLAYVISQR